MKIKIGITDCGRKHINYESWILSSPHEIEIIRLGYRFDNFSEIKKCDGVLLSGGEDIHPKFYNQSANLHLCNQNFMDEKRDIFELKVCEYIFKHQVPMLGICRGLQLTNVFLGGTLIPDIPTLGKNNHSMLNLIYDHYHKIAVTPETELAKIIGNISGEINSAHHQAVDEIANGLIINSLSDDEIVEGLEYSEPDHKHKMMLVQWHPERMLNLESEFSKTIRNNFIESICK